MLSIMNVRGAAVAALMTLVCVSGCGGEASDDAAQEPAAASPTASQAPATTGGDTDCLLGRWYLDTEQYAAQALDYMAGLGIPISALQISGNQILDFSENPYLNVATDLQLDAVVSGQSLSVGSQSAGGGEWGWNGDSTTDIGVDNWEWNAEPAVAQDGAPPLIDPSQGIAVSCASDQLTVQGSGAPLAGVFVRR